MVIIVFTKLEPNYLDFDVANATWYGFVARQNNKHLSLTIYIYNLLKLDSCLVIKIGWEMPIWSGITGWISLYKVFIVFSSFSSSKSLNFYGIINWFMNSERRRAGDYSRHFL